MKKFLFTLILALFYSASNAQINDSLEFDFNNVAEYKVAAVRVVGVTNLDKDILVIISGIRPGKTIKVPGEELPNAVKALWRQGLFGDVKIVTDSIVGDKIYLTYLLQERPRISHFAYPKGLRKSTLDDINDELKRFKGSVLNENVKQTCANSIRSIFIKKGNYEVKTTFEEIIDTAVRNGVILKIKIDPGPKFRIGEVDFNGNTELTDKKALRTYKKVKPYLWYYPLRGCKFSQSEFEDDKKKLIAKYKDLGYRDMNITSDSVVKISENRYRVVVNIEEGKKYYFRNVYFNGNTIYPDSILSQLLDITAGDTYNQGLLEQHLYMDPSGRDITSLYMDNGYLFFQVTPNEIPVGEDSIDINVEIIEGAQAVINRIVIKGNEKTADHVILRELHTRPGQKFSRADIIRTTRELGQLGYFDPEQINIKPIPNPNDGTVDLEYTVVEKSSDQVELSGGYGGSYFVGSLGLTLNNFAARNVFKPNKWNPVPSGDGQRLGIRAVANASFFRSYNFSFTEPWLGGKKPNALSVSIYSSQQFPNGAKFTTTNGVKTENKNFSQISILGATVGLGKRLKKPDDFFNTMTSLNYQRFTLTNYQLNALQNGTANSIFLRQIISRNSVGDNPIFPTYGSSVSLTISVTPPWSRINGKDYSKMTNSEKYKLVEYHKWRFEAVWYTSLSRKFVLATNVQLGFLGGYNNLLDQPFGRFYVGGSGLTGFNIDDRELIRMRGYKDNSIGPRSSSGPTGGKVFQRFTAELRYPITLNPQASIYALAFIEAGNNFSSLRAFRPFDNMKSAGVGIRVFLPMFGLLGVDWGYGFDVVPNNVNANKGNIAVSIGQTF